METHTDFNISLNICTLMDKGQTNKKNI